MGPSLRYIYMESLLNSPSPNKRSSFRSKTKLPLASTMSEIRPHRSMPSFYVYMKEFPLDTSEEILATVRSFEPTHNSFLENLENLRLYKPQLGNLLQDNWHDFMLLFKAAALKLHKRAERMTEEKEKKIAQLLKINRELEAEQQKWREKIQKLEGLRELESAQLSMADAELEIVSGEMRDIYKVLQGDMEKVSRYLTRLEASRASSEQEGSSEIYSSLKTMSLLLNSMEAEQRTTNTSLSSMRELIKAMTKCTKVTTGTQVDESQLLTQAGAIFSQGTDPMPFELAEASGVNVDASNPHLIDQLKSKQKQHPHEPFKQQKHAEKPWALTPVLLAFLENMSKQNQAGKVLPWEYTKQLIRQIYEQRSVYQVEMTAGCIGNGMLFDEFVVFYFLNKHRIRRLAEVKLLEFIISLKYYSKYWLKAEIFCQFMDVMRYQPLFQPAESFNYKLDYNTQNFFFAIYKKMVTYSCVEEEGATFVQTKQVKKLMRASLYFTEELNRSRLLAKLDKDQRVFDKIDHCDFDFAMALFLDQYLACKKKICNTLNKAFSRKFQTNQGYFSIDEMQDLFEDMTPIYRMAADMQYRYPVDSRLQLAKLYLYTATSGKNSYDFNANHFITACQRYGFDAPFPFLHVCPKGKKSKEEPVEEKAEPVKEAKAEAQRIKSARMEEAKPQMQIIPGQQGGNISKQRVDVGVKLFSQHFGIIRQLKMYVDIFSKTLREQKNHQTLWKSFDQIRTILQRGCEFMRYPLIDPHKK